MGIIKKKEDDTQEFSWIRYIRNRILKKKNFLCLVSGPTGSGKSYTCLSVALLLDKNFGPERIVFGLRGLMQLINSDEKFPAGTVFVWDEFQIDSSNRNWMSLTNKLLNSLLSTFRHKNFILLINSPYADFIDSHARKLLHAEWEIKGINFVTERTIVKPMILQYNSRQQKTYYKYLRIKNNKKVGPITKWSVPKPPKWILEEYERKKHEFTSELNKSIEVQLNKLDTGKKTLSKELTLKQKEVLDLFLKSQNVSEVAKYLNLNKKTVRFHLQQIRKKGFDTEKPVENAVKIEKERDI